jgi:hypothetical protein
VDLRASSFGGAIGAGDDELWGDQQIAVEEILAFTLTRGGSPHLAAGTAIEPADDSVARSDENGVARDRGRMRESTTRIELPKELYR